MSRATTELGTTMATSENCDCDHGMQSVTEYKGERVLVKFGNIDLEPGRKMPSDQYSQLRFIYILNRYMDETGDREGGMKIVDAIKSKSNTFDGMSEIATKLIKYHDPMINDVEIHLSPCNKCNQGKKIISAKLNKTGETGGTTNYKSKSY